MSRKLLEKILRIDETQDPQLNRQYNSDYKKPDRVEPNIIKVPTFNWVPDKKDDRDYKYIPVGQEIIRKVDLRPFCSSIETQGKLGSCTGNAVAGAIEYLSNKSNNSIDVSRLFIYYYTRLLEGTVKYDSGAYIRDTIKAVYMYGAPKESLWPYDVSKFRIKPSSPAIKEASTRKVTRYERVNSFEGCIDALTDGYPVTIGFYIYSSFSSEVVEKTGMMPYPDVKKEKLIGGHAVLLVGYDRDSQHFIARNSWGDGWGDKGYFYIPFRVIQNRNLSVDFWVIKTVNNL